MLRFADHEIVAALLECRAERERQGDQGDIGAAAVGELRGLRHVLANTSLSCTFSQTPARFAAPARARPVGRELRVGDGDAADGGIGEILEREPVRRASRSTVLAVHGA